MTKNRPLNILVPRLVDVDNHNAQNLNAKALLSRFTSPDVIWHTFHYSTPDPAVAGRDNVRCHQLIHGRFWTWHAILKYQGRYDAIFYPGNEKFDDVSLGIRKLTGRKIPIVSTLEIIPPADAEILHKLSEIAGHEIKSLSPQNGMSWARHHNSVRNNSDHIIAISPLLEKAGQLLYGDKLSFIPLGIDSSVFNAGASRRSNKHPIVVGVGTLQARKRPEVFIKLARHFPAVTFEWYGEGNLRESLSVESANFGLSNLRFAGPLPARELSEKYRNSDLMVIPSHVEGVPKASQEAAACGLPVMLFGYYEAFSVIDGENGFVVWSDEEIFHRLSELLDRPELAAKMGRIGARLASAWDWDVLAPQWESAIKAQIPS
jgi:glycosyltransferase involved in cell wall biosynthesis